MGLFFFFICLCSCAAQPSVSDFYEGLIKKQAGDSAGAAAHFINALDSANACIAASAAAELISLFDSGSLDPAEFPEKHIERARQIAAPSGAAGEIDMDDIPGHIASALAEGRSAVMRYRYREALVFFRMALEELPYLFFRHPDLLNDLGRSFQYAATGSEGADLFIEWEKMIAAEDDSAEGEAMRAAIPEGFEGATRYRLLFFAGRIMRHAEARKNSIELFERALLFVPPDGGQSDACIWYILDGSLGLGADAAIQYLEKYISQWHDTSYFMDLMDRLARELILKRQWEKMLRVFSIVRGHSDTATAKFAWIIGRAIDEGLFSPDELNIAASHLHGSPPAGGADKIAKEFIRISYNALALPDQPGESVNRGFLLDSVILYYRVFSAAFIGEPFFEPSEAKAVSAAGSRKSRASVKRSAKEQPLSDTMEFLLGFFSHDTAQFAPGYVRPLENDLPADDLRRIAGALNAAGNYRQSIRLASLYLQRDSGYRPNREDMELLYPQPYRELVEQYAAETGLEPALLFGLIRTESAFDSGAVSRAGAIGLTQLMPATAEEMAGRIFRQGGPDYTRGGTSAEGVSFPDLREPAVNIHIGAAYLSYLGDRMEDPLLSLLAYNGGMTRIRRWYRAAPANLPPDLFLETVEYAETRDYGRRVISAAAMYRELYYK